MKKLSDGPQTYRFGRFSAWPLGLSIFLLINAASFLRQSDFRLAAIVFAIPLLVVWLRLRVRLTPTSLEVRNLFSTTSLNLDDPNSHIRVQDGAFYVVHRDGTNPVRAWGVDGSPTSRNEGAAEKMEELCSTLLRRTFRRGGATIEF